jgi:hypothetical protein
MLSCQYQQKNHSFLGLVALLSQMAGACNHIVAADDIEEVVDTLGTHLSELVQNGGWSHPFD